MTKDKAIEILKHCGAENYCFDYQYRNCANCNQRIAQNMAIEALKTEAIPIERIRKYTEENRLYQSDDFDIYINDMIADWTEEKKDIRICGICKHFLGGGDFGTCCDQTYDLKYTDSKVCEKYSERKEE